MYRDFLRWVRKSMISYQNLSLFFLSQISRSSDIEFKKGLLGAVWHNMGYHQGKFEGICRNIFGERCRTNFLHGEKSTILGKILNEFVKENLYFFGRCRFFKNFSNLCDIFLQKYSDKSLQICVRVTLLYYMARNKPFLNY